MHQLHDILTGTIHELSNMTSVTEYCYLLCFVVTRYSSSSFVVIHTVSLLFREHPSCEDDRVPDLETACCHEAVMVK